MNDDRLVSNYFEEGFWRSDNPEGVRVKVGAYHWTLSTLMSGLVEAGLLLERLAEPIGAGPSGTGRVPSLLIARCRKL